MNIKMYFLPELYNEKRTTEFGIVIDLLRNSTMITVLFERGIYKLIPISNISSAFQFREFIKFGEKNSLKIDKFDYGNSPSEIKNMDFTGKTGVIYSTNGTKAMIKTGKQIPHIIIASMRNARAVATYITSLGMNIPIILSGHNGAIALEDVYCGGFLVDNMLQKNKDMNLNDSSYMALSLYRSQKNNLVKSVRNTDHGRELIRSGFERDIDISLEKNVTDLIPIYHKGIIRLAPLP